MLKHPVHFILGIAVLAVLFYVAVSIFTENDEARVRRAVYTGVAGLEHNDPRLYGRIISSSYMDDDGNDKAAVLKKAGDLFKEYKPFRVEIKAMKIEVEGLEATSTIGYRCLFKRDEPDKKIYYDAGKVTAFWRKESAGDWKIVKIEYMGSHEILFLPVVA
ncbi:MAG: hypothetical protein PHH75_04880 [Candidatus Omnitrophica bacterium]|nr:hypothetical protein [Candidatus Omnitrophota bacterium]MDD5574496.1 hypothetical protein [Candidatus Omnitrophota bacterium]